MLPIVSPIPASLFLLALLCFPLLSFAGPSCNEDDYKRTRFQAIQTRIINGYRFDITKQPVYVSDDEVDEEYREIDGEGCAGDSFILVTDADERVVFFKRMKVPLYFVTLETHSNQQQNKADIAVKQITGGACCEYFHLFQTKPMFKYLGRQD